MAFFDDIKVRVNKAAQSVSSKTKENMELSRLTGEGKGIQGEIEALFSQIGRAYVESEGGDAEGLAALCARVAELKARLEELEKQKLLLKNQNACPACGAVMAKDAKFCSNCGAKMPEPPEPEPEPEPEAEDEPEAEAEAEVEPEAEGAPEEAPEAEPEAETEEKNEAE